MSPSFVHLHLHTEYSLVDGTVRIPALVEALGEAGMPACAVTEQSNVFSFVKFYRAAQSAGIKPIIGADLWLGGDGATEQPFRLVVLCQNNQGFRSLCRLVTWSYSEGQGGGAPTVRWEWLEENADGLIALSAGVAGDVGQLLLAERTREAERRLERWLALFPERYYIELQRTGREAEELCVQASVDVASRLGVPVVATNDVRFLRADDFEAHEARVCIHEGRVLADSRRPRDYSQQQYLRTPQEMAALFEDLPEALENSVEIARRCSLELELGRDLLPEFPLPEGTALDDHLVVESRAGLSKRLRRDMRACPEPAGDGRSEYEQRLQLELDIITKMGFSGYFLIVADFVRWARAHAIPVGPGRGSGTGSLVAYSLGITDLDPIEYELLFERFLNPERISLPDFDIDFCMNGRDKVIDYVVKRYGSGEEHGECVAQIVTFGSMAAKAVVRDAGRVLGYPYGYVDQLANLIPNELGITLERALSEEPLQSRYRDEEDVRNVMDLARKLEGLARNVGLHAAGVVIAPSTLTNFMPLYCERGSSTLVTQLDKNDVEAMGLVKFDFLGLRTLTIIDSALRTINERRRVAQQDPIEISAIATDDTATFELIKSGATTAVFQLESRGMKDLIRRLQPDRFADIVALVALFRPGPLQSGMVDDFINRKQGRASVEYLHPDLAHVLEPTYGVILYQEQVMQIAQVLAGYTLGGADILRSAMGKKKPEEMAKQREVFVEGATARGVDKGSATYIFDLMEKFAGYGFNKAHSTGYALITYQTAWLKAHYPAAFMAAVLSADMDNTDKVVTLIDESRAIGLSVEPPDINACAFAFTAEGEETIRYGLGAIKGAGESAIESIIAERDAGGPFRDLFDFCRRVDTRRANRRVIEALIRSGALDDLGPGRSSMMASLTLALQTAEQHGRDISTGQNDLFGGAAIVGEQENRFSDAPEWSDEERLAGEKMSLGLYLSGHPITPFETELDRFTSVRLSDLRPKSGEIQIVAGMVVGIRKLNSRAGRMAVITIDDRTARMDAVIYSDLFSTHHDLLVKDKLLVLEGEVSVDDFTGGASMTVQKVSDLDGARETFARNVVIRLAAERVGNGLLDEIRDVVRVHQHGQTLLCIDYARPGASVRLPLGDDWRVHPTQELLRSLAEIVGPESIDVEY
ncbi:MAG: DNA polymerase III subunit alpha [Gammaproteobacteria bacterium]|nr:DNA polymerase III subunit alpha [Gammaproteobacteria bacterium]NIP88073.1 DNA polymerase III subunit alpha [Gammaproteobacteria bacterium]NIR22583.1 DNA polymerase III subunit alpha [Gammaproteobacteria bacterium]NIS04482.1 DNA polymerase III subunit alpha [Gammaproteobacteria bacterium]NIU42440.1 DNA polymerase III subunit alpha [Gammaproteobacteria bacterium]